MLLVVEGNPEKMGRGSVVAGAARGSAERAVNVFGLLPCSWDPNTDCSPTATFEDANKLDLICVYGSWLLLFPNRLGTPDPLRAGGRVSFCLVKKLLSSGLLLLFLNKLILLTDKYFNCATF